MQLALLAMAFAVLVIISSASVYWLKKAREDAAWVTHTLEFQNQISLALLQIRRAESAERGYLLTQRPEFLADFEGSGPLILPLLKQIESGTRDNRVQQDLMARIKPLAERRVAIISTAGLHKRGDRPFRPGDGSYRVIPAETPANALVMSHISVNFDRTGFQQDLNVVFPIDRLRELVADGTVGSMASVPAHSPTSRFTRAISSLSALVHSGERASR